jgi:putative oxidoreductase
MIKKIYHSYANLHDRLSPHARDVLLLIIRLQWGIGFFLTGRGKFINFDRTVEFFTSLDIPMAKQQAVMAAGTELVGGLLLALGAGSKIVPIPLIGTMVVAYATAHREELLGIFSNPDGFLEAPPFLFLLASVLVFLFGAGRYSVDALIAKRCKTSVDSVTAP